MGVESVENQNQQRKSTGFLIKQRAFLKIYLITYIEQNQSYGMQLLDDIKSRFDRDGYKPQHSEIYRALHELLEEGVLTRGKIVKEGSKYQEVAVYHIGDKEKVNAYKKLIKHDLERCISILQKAVKDNFP